MVPTGSDSAFSYDSEVESVPNLRCQHRSSKAGITLGDETSLPGDDAVEHLPK